MNRATLFSLFVLGTIGCRGLLGISDGVGLDDDSGVGGDDGAPPDGEALDGGDGAAFDGGSDARDVVQTDTTPSCNGSPAGKRIFVTSQRYIAQLGGLSSADIRCQTLANLASLGGTFKAWLSDDTTSAASRMAQSSGPYVRVDNVLLAASFTELVTTGPRQAIFLTERCTQPPASDGGGPCPSAPYLVWTGTAADGSATPGSTCSGWTSSSGPGVRAGSAAPSDIANWSTFCNGTGSGVCSGDALLYCVEQ